MRYPYPDYIKKSGHIGYGVSPQFRNQGIASRMLRAALIIAKEKGLEEVLLVCDKDNLGSSGAIKNNDGKLESEYECEDVMEQRYWITL